MIHTLNNQTHQNIAGKNRNGHGNVYTDSREVTSAMTLIYALVVLQNLFYQKQKLFADNFSY